MFRRCVGQSHDDGSLRLHAVSRYRVVGGAIIAGFPPLIYTEYMYVWQERLALAALRLHFRGKGEIDVACLPSR